MTGRAARGRQRLGEFRYIIRCRTSPEFVGPRDSLCTCAETKPAALMPGRSAQNFFPFFPPLLNELPGKLRWGLSPTPSAAAASAQNQTTLGRQSLIRPGKRPGPGQNWHSLQAAFSSNETGIGKNCNPIAAGC